MSIRWTMLLALLVSIIVFFSLIRLAAGEPLFYILAFLIIISLAWFYPLGISNNWKDEKRVWVMAIAAWSLFFVVFPFLGSSSTTGNASLKIAEQNITKLSEDKYQVVLLMQGGSAESASSFSLMMVGLFFMLALLVLAYRRNPRGRDETASI